MQIESFSYWEHRHWMQDIDVLVVGAGLTGLQTALEIKREQAAAKVVVVDRWSWSQGASLKNAGFACFANMGELLDDLRYHSEEEVYSLVKQRYDGLKYLIGGFGAEQIGYIQKGSVELFDDTNEAELMLAIDTLQDVNTRLYEELGLDRVFHFSSKVLPTFKGGIHNAYEGQLNTGKLYRVIWEACMQAGVQIWGGLQLDSWSSDERVHVHFDTVDLTCSQLILCTNAFAGLHTVEDIVPARGQVMVTEFLDKLPKGLHMYDKGYYYWRDIDRRIMIGGARNLDPDAEQDHRLESNEQIRQKLKQFVEERVLGREVKIDMQWAGIMGMGSKKSKQPIVRSLESNVFLAARLGGMGVALSSQVARQVKRLILD